MMDSAYDLLVIGSGFAGSLSAMIASRLGYSVLLVERRRHPRMAIGESSTPLANLLLEKILRQYGLEEFVPLTAWGSWQEHFPGVACGKKRGFTFYYHHLGEKFSGSRDEQLLVAANPNDRLADTHWYRPHFDHLFAKAAVEAGAELREETELLSAHENDRGFSVHLRTGKNQSKVQISFLLDASGPRGCLSRFFSIPEAGRKREDETESIYAHFSNVSPLSGDFFSPGEKPFHPDDAAVHHLFEGGWIWVLRFNNQITSAGVSASARLAQELGFQNPEKAWAFLMARLPSVAEHFCRAEPASPIYHLPRLRYRAERAAGAGWAMLPSAAGFIDPLLSTGFPLTLLGIARLMKVFEKGFPTAEALGQYERELFADLGMAEDLVEALYQQLDDFEFFSGLSRLYFAAASYSEVAVRLGRSEPLAGYLLRDDPNFLRSFRSICERAKNGERDKQLMLREVRQTIGRYDIAGLNDPSRCNWHPFKNSDLLENRHKLGASEAEIQNFLQSMED